MAEKQKIKHIKLPNGEVYDIATDSEVAAPNDAKLTINQNGKTVATFSANASKDVTVNLTDHNDNTNTTYSIAKSGSTVTLTGSDGSTSSFTDADTKYGTVSTTSNGLMTKDDKTKLNGIEAGANKVTNNNQLTNGAGYQTASQVSSAIADAVGKVTQFDYEVVTALPSTGVKGKIYLIADTHSDSNDSYDEYMWIGDKFEKIGNTDVDLSQYVKTDDARLSNSRPASDVKAWAKADSKPSYAWSEITGKPARAGASTDGGAATSANKVNHTLSVQLNGGTAQTFNGSADTSINVTPASIGAQPSGSYVTTSDSRLTNSRPASDVSAWAKKSTLSEAINSDLTTGSATPVDGDYYISQYVNGGTTTTTYHRRPMSALWEYVKGKISSVLGLTKDSYGGKAANATSADNAAKVNNHSVNADVPANAKFTDTNTWNALKGATTSADGSAGYAPAPAKGDVNRYLRCDGTWVTPPNNNTTYNSTTKSYTLSASSWSNGQYTISDSLITASSYQEITTGIGITADQYKAFSAGMIVDGGQSAGNLILKCLGTVPTIDIPIRVIYRGTI